MFVSLVSKLYVYTIADSQTISPRCLYIAAAQDRKHIIHKGAKFVARSIPVASFV
jgi:hypothetical protein